MGDIHLLRKISRTDAFASPGDVLNIQLHQEASLLSVRKQLQAARTLVKLLENQVDVSEESIALCRFICAPIRRLPTEILSRIFAFSCTGDILFYSKNCTVSESYTYASDSDPYSTPPTRLGQEYNPVPSPPRPTSHALARVCKYWRDTAMQTSSIWKHFVIVNTIPRSGDGSRRLGQLLDFYGERLGHLGFKTTVAANSRIFTIIAKHFNHITSLSLSSTLKHLADMTFTLPALQELRLSDESLSISHTAVTFNVPGLKKLYLHRRRATDLGDISLPWEQLEYLSIGSKEGAAGGHLVFSSQIFTQTFSRLTNLIYLHLPHIRVDAELRPDDPIVLPKLRALELHTTTLSKGHTVLGIISTPMLEEFDLVLTGRKCDDTLSSATSSIKHFLEVSPHLQRIRTVCCPSAWDSRLRGSPRRREKGLPRLDIFSLAGNAQFFREVGGKADNEDVRFPHAQVKSTPFIRWPGDVISLDRFIDRFLENGRAYSDVPRVKVGEGEGGPGYQIRQDDSIKDPSRIANSVFRDILGVNVDGIPDGERRAYIIGQFTVDKLTKYSRS